MRIETYLDAANTYLFRLASLWFRTPIHISSIFHLPSDL